MYYATKRYYIVTSKTNWTAQYPSTVEGWIYSFRANAVSVGADACCVTTTPLLAAHRAPSLLGDFSKTHRSKCLFDEGGGKSAY